MTAPYTLSWLLLLLYISTIYQGKLAALNRWGGKLKITIKTTIKIVVFNVFMYMRVNYVGDRYVQVWGRTCWVSDLLLLVTSKMKHGKAAGLDELTVEHLANDHPVFAARCYA